MLWTFQARHNFFLSLGGQKLGLTDLDHCQVREVDMVTRSMADRGAANDPVIAVRLPAKALAV